MNVGRILQRHSGSLKGWSQGVITYSSVFAIFFSTRDYLSICISRSLNTLGNFDLKLGQTLSAAQGLGPCTQTNQNGVPK